MYTEEDFVIDEHLIGVDHETTIQAYLARDIEFNRYPNEIVQSSLQKLSFDGNGIYYLNSNFEPEIKYISPDFLSYVIKHGNIESFYRYIGFDALNYLGY